MKNRYAITAVLGILILGALAGCSTSIGSSSNKTDAIEASGVIEAEEVNIAPELSGKVSRIYVKEGDRVNAGDVVLSLDDDMLLAQQTQAQAAHDAAAAQVDSAKAAQVAAQAALRSAELELEAARIAYQSTLLQVSQLEGDDRVADWNEITPSQFDLPAWYFQQPENIDTAQRLVDQAWDAYQAELENYQDTAADVGGDDFLQAETRLAEAKAAFEIADNLRDRPLGSTGRQEIQDQVDTIYDEADAELKAAQKAYDLLLTNPDYDEILESRARVSVAREQYDLTRDYLLGQYVGDNSLAVQAANTVVEQAQAGLTQAQAQVDQAASFRTSVETSLQQAQAALDLVSLQLEKQNLTSPISGVILSRTVEIGEVVGAGYTVLTVGDLENLTVTVYIPEDKYGKVALGDPAGLTIDSYPDKVFDAEVIWISDQAEYTPRNVQTQEERQNTVYAVKLSIKANSILKPGMPADVIFSAQ